MWQQTFFCCFIFNQSAVERVVLKADSQYFFKAVKILFLYFCLLYTSDAADD